MMSAMVDQVIAGLSASEIRERLIYFHSGGLVGTLQLLGITVQCCVH